MVMKIKSNWLGMFEDIEGVIPSPPHIPDIAVGRVVLAAFAEPREGLLQDITGGNFFHQVHTHQALAAREMPPSATVDSSFLG